MRNDSSTWTIVVFLCFFCFQAVQAAEAPYPGSSVIAQIEWEPPSGIERGADGSDNWPLTWGSDGNLYGAYGDGFGFEPMVPSKLSMGFARITGSPESWSGENIRSPQEQTGDGSAGKKASSFLAIDDRLYMWIRNADEAGKECQLAWSDDYAQTWIFSDWTFAELGYCVFLNFGQAYADARDGFVYTYSPNGPSAYDAEDEMVLLRVPKEEIANQSAYEYFAGLQANGDPTWSSNSSTRQPVFKHANNCLRSGISYNVVLQRYFWWQQIAENGVDTRYSGGFGIYDAPEPWGPWTTAHFDENWDVGPGDSASFPTKWISSDGKTMYLAFAGDDHFSVRSAQITLTDRSIPRAPVINDN